MSNGARKSPRTESYQAIYMYQYLHSLWWHRNVSPLVRKLFSIAFLREVKHFCATMERGDIDTFGIRSNLGEDIEKIISFY